MHFRVSKMDAGAIWRSTVMLTLLLSAETVHSLPKPSETEAATTTYTTLYPPSSQGARLAYPSIGAYYPTGLEREGHPDVQPFPTFGLNDLLDDVDSDSLVEGLVPDFSPDSEPSESSEGAPEATSAPSVTTPSFTTSIPETITGPTDIEVPTEVPSTSLTHSAPEVHTPESTSTSETNPVEDGASPPSDSTTSETGAADAEAFIPQMAGQDVFVPLPGAAIPANIKPRNDHPVARTGIANATVPIETNKFYAGLFLGSQTNATFVHPYALAWAKGHGNASSYGMAISHTELDKIAQGPPQDNIPGSPMQFYVNPIGIQSVILSAAELTTSTLLTTENPLPFSADAVLQPNPGSQSRITFPLVQGMGFVTGIYKDLQPLIQSSVFFHSIVPAGSPRPGIFKYRLFLEDQSTWLLYAIPDDGKDPKLGIPSKIDVQGPPGWSGTIQVAKNPAGPSGEKFYDNSAGVFAMEGVITGSVSRDIGRYDLAWAKAGKDVQSTPLLMFALPHHVESFDRGTRGRVTNIQLRTTTKGNATAVIGESWTLIEPGLPIDMGFAPWSPKAGNIERLSPQAQKAILDGAPTELGQDISGQSDQPSMYFGGKALSKFATLIYTVEKLANSPSLAAPALQELKKCFAVFIDNKQKFPLVYDTVWKGAVSSASYGGDIGADFGNTLYNDHHFHYGYFIHAAAIIGHLDPSWIPANKDYVNMLVRDAGNAAKNDPFFPFSRGFDWYHGHSWAKGLFESHDGKDQESSSEDTMFAYALKMWGKTIGDASMEARGNLMLGLLRRTLHHYFLIESDNKNHPPKFVGNKVTGIFFENKVDHTTYFGNNLEFIQGIHMLPLLPASPYVRNTKFVTEEWNAMFASNASSPAEKVEGGWQGVLYANLALVDPVAAWRFFSKPNFNYGAIDGGASRVWYLAFAAGLGGAP